MLHLIDELSYFFATLPDNIVPLLGIVGLLIFTVGLLLGWFIQRRSTLHFRQRALLAKTDRDAAVTRAEQLQRERQALDRNLQVTTAGKTEALERVRTLETEVAGWDRSSQRLLEKVSQLETTNQSYASTIESLNNQLIGLKTQNEHLANSSDAQPGAGLDTWRDELGADAGAGQLGGRARAPEGGPFDVEFNPAASGAPLPEPDKRALERRLQDLEDRLAALAEARALAELPETTPGRVATSADTASIGEEEVFVGTTQHLLSPSLETEPVERDDLTRIRKIGPFLEGQLNNVDIYRYTQIAAWTAEDVENYTQLIGYVEGAIEQDDWVGQARALAKEATQLEVVTDEQSATSPLPPPVTTPEVLEQEYLAATGDFIEPRDAPIEAPVEKPSEAHPNADDPNLRIVEGIGPRIQELLRKEGIDTIGKLANSTTEEIQSILDGAGGSFRFHDPKTWVAQAGLAADGRLEELKTWQGELRGGL